MKRLWLWFVEHPFRSSVIVILIIVIPGFVRIENIANDTNDAAIKAEAAAEDTQRQADRNTAIIDCMTKWVAALTDALQDRDVVAKTARAAQQEMWDTIRHWMETQPVGADRTEVLRAIERFQMILGRLERTAAINPYPEIEKCLGDAASIAAKFALMSAKRQAVCFGYRITIHGSGQDDVIHGTDGSDIIRTYRGRDIIHAGGGRDLVCGGRGNDIINGGQDYDQARGQKGRDFCIKVESRRSC